MATDPDIARARTLAKAARDALFPSGQHALEGDRLEAVVVALNAVEPLCRKLEADQAGPEDGGDLGGPGPQTPREAMQEAINRPVDAPLFDGPQPSIHVHVPKVSAGGTTASPERGTRVDTPAAHVDRGRGYAEGGYIRPAPNIHIQQFDDLLFALRELRAAEDTLKRLDKSRLLGDPDAIHIQRLLHAIDAVRPMFTRPTREG